MSDNIKVIPLLARALQRLRATPPRCITSPPTQPRRAAVALIIRVVPSPSAPPPLDHIPSTLPEFFELDWVHDKDAHAEILFLRRDSDRDISQNKPRNTSEAHVAFPGGRMEDGDEGGLYTAMRQTWEEIGIDLAEKNYTCVGQLDDREITTSLGKRLLMILSPFVFLQITPNAPPPDPAPGTVLHWVPLSTLVCRPPRWSTVTVDVSSRLAPRHSTFLRLLVRLLVGTMQFAAILVDTSASRPFVAPAYSDTLEYSEKAVDHVSSHTQQDLKLWGLSLGMTLDLMAYMIPSRRSTPIMADDVTGIAFVPPSMTSVFPRFSYPDVNFWIWVFGKRYREVIRGWEVSMRYDGSNDRRINWTGTALNTFYAAVRKALVLVIILRALGILVGLSIGGWWLWIRH